MNRIHTLALAILSLAFVSSMVMAQPAPAAQGRGAAPQPRPSPLDVTRAAIDGSPLMIVYSRPFSKAPNSEEIRKIWGTLVPYGQVWRFGANEAAHLITQQPLTFGNTTIPAGAYTLFMLPQENGPSRLIINKQVAQLGTEYDEKQDAVRVDMTRTALPEQVNQFSITITPNPGGGGAINVRWENTQFSVPFTVKK